MFVIIVMQSHNYFNSFLMKQRRNNRPITVPVSINILAVLEGISLKAPQTQIEIISKRTE